MNLENTETPKKEILLLGNGSRVEISNWSIDKKYLSGHIVNSTPTIFVYLPVSYLACNIVKKPKKR